MRLPWEFIEAGEHKCSTAQAQSCAVANSVRLQWRSVLLLATVFCTYILAQEAFKDFQGAVLELTNFWCHLLRAGALRTAVLTDWQRCPRGALITVGAAGV